VNFYASFGDKSETRNPKSETNSNIEIKMMQTNGAGGRISIWYSDFDLVSDFDIRISDFRPGRISGSGTTRATHLPKQDNR
jgi:hypothetical protein